MAPPDDAQAFASLLRRQRLRAGLTQEELADRAGVSVRSVRNWERRIGPTPRIHSVDQLAKVLFSDPEERAEFQSRARAVLLPTPGDGGRPVPAQLPADSPAFVGRRGALAILSTALTDRVDQGRTVVIVTIGGAEGIGKTWLALHWAHRNIDRFPDGQLFVNLRGFDPTGQPTPPDAAVRGLLDALGVAPQDVPADPDAQIGLYRSLVTGRRILVVLDNARDTTQVNALLPGSATGTVIVTSRDQLTGLISRQGAHSLRLDILDDHEAHDLLSRRLGGARLAAERDAVAALIAGCGGLPLALATVAAWAATQPHLSLAAIAADLGAQPGAEPRTVQLAIRRQALAEAPPAQVSPVPSDRPVPAMLPLDIRGFAGRADQLRQLDQLLPGTADESTATTLVALSGGAGIGKTTLAIHWAHRVRAAFPHGQLYANLGGFDPGGMMKDPGEVLRTFLDALGVPPQRIPLGLDAQAGLYRSELADRRVLVVLDNARDAEQIRPLLPGSPSVHVVITSRSQLTSVVATAGAHLITLDLLTEAESYQLLALRVGRHRVAREPEATAEIITRCARLPLALAIVAADASTHPDLPFSAVAKELGRIRDGFVSAVADDPSTDLRAVFSRSYEALSTDAARLFRFLGLHPGPDISEPAAASLVGTTNEAAAALLVELVGAHMVTERPPGRYASHDLLREYAAQVALDQDSGADRQSAIRRALDHYLFTAHAAALLLNPHRDPIDLGSPHPATNPEKLTNLADALDWLATEHTVLIRAVSWAAATGFDTHVGRLVWTLATFLERHGHWRDQAAAQQAALRAAHRLDDLSGQARAHRDLGTVLIRQARYDQAQIHLNRAVELYVRLGDQTGEAHTQLQLGILAQRGEGSERAIHHDRRALRLFEAAGHRYGQARALNSIGWCLAQLGQYEQTLILCSRALTLLQEIGNRAGEAHTWDTLGFAHSQLGNHTRAIAEYQRALALFRNLEDRHNESDTLNRLGHAHLAAGDSREARTSWREALQILVEFTHPDAEQVRAQLRLLESGVAEQ